MTMQESAAHGAVEAIVLGSGTPNPTPGRAGAGLAVAAGGDWVLVDCGRGVTQRALDAGLDLGRLRLVAITHHHSDHLSDLATLAIARWVAGAGSPLTVVAPVGPSADHARRCLDAFPDGSFHGQASDPASPRPGVAVHAFAAGGAVAGVWEAGGWRLSSALVDHHPVSPAVGYRVQRGAATVAVSGDTAACAGMAALATGADVLVHEAVLTERASPALLAWNARARTVGELATSAGAGSLVLTHLLPAPTSPEVAAAYVAEVRAGGYGGPVVVADDLARIPARPGPEP